jgi:branched-chain amino acid transport system ATP-binding protein
MLEVRGIKVFIGESEVLSQISLEVKTGERVGIIGPNGHGKSVTLKTISGLFKPKRGEILFDGKDLIRLNPREIVEAGITLVPEGGHLFPEMTVFENLLLGAYIPEARRHKDQSLERVYNLFPKLKELHRQKCNALSGGELRMAAVARGLMTYPRLLMLDEPTLGLAPNLVEAIGQKLYELVKGQGKNHDQPGARELSIILADENIDLMADVAERAYFIEDGKIRLEGGTKDVLENEYVRKTYLGID